MGQGGLLVWGGGALAISWGGALSTIVRSVIMKGGAHAIVRSVIMKSRAVGLLIEVVSHSGCSKGVRASLPLWETSLHPLGTT